MFSSELGAHIDGFAALAAHTLVIGASAVCSRCKCIIVQRKSSLTHNQLSLRHFYVQPLRYFYNIQG